MAATKQSPTEKQSENQADPISLIDDLGCPARKRVGFSKPGKNAPRSKYHHSLISKRRKRIVHSSAVTHDSLGFSLVSGFMER